MVPLDEETLALLDRIAATRSAGRPIPHPRTGGPAQFLFTHHGKRLSQNALRSELNRATAAAGLDHVTPHQLRHTYATALVNAGVSLQALMALLGHVSAAMSLRYARLFDTPCARSTSARWMNSSRRGPWKGLDDVELATLEWVDWHNYRRLRSACYDMPPAEYEQIHYGQHPAQLEAGVSTA